MTGIPFIVQEGIYHPWAQLDAKYWTQKCKSREITEYYIHDTKPDTNEAKSLQKLCVGRAANKKLP